MRLTIVILIASLNALSASTLAQKITLFKSNAPLSEIFKEIKIQSGYNFIYRDNVLEKAKPVSIKVTQMQLDEVLKAVFEEQPFTYEVNSKTVIVKEERPSLLDKLSSVISNIVRDFTVKGKVVDQEGKPLPNASIRIKGKNAVTNTNQNGEFEIGNVPEDAVLLVSYVGFKMLEIPVKGAVMPLEIKLNQTTGELEEVSVTYSTGYQNIPKERATGSFAQVSNKLFNEQVGTTVLSRLEGIVNGLVVDKKRTGNPASIMIRGLSTIQGQANPLIVLDNFPYEGDLSNINPNDVENITVLKDAAAASIWGSRAGNGVIVITTKKGKFNTPLSIDFNANATIVEKPDLFYLNKITSSDLVDVESFLFDKKFKFSDTSNTLRPAFSPVYETLFKLSSGKISQAEADAQLNTYRNTDVRDDLNKYVYRNGLNQQYALAFRGGSKDLKYNLSAGYDRNLTDVSAKSNRASIRSNMTYQLSKKLSLTTGLTYTKGNNYSGKEAITAKYPYLKLADENGVPLRVDRDLRRSFLDTVGRGKLLNWDYYPLEDYKYSHTKQDRNDFLADLGIQYQLIDGLSINLNYLYEKQLSYINKTDELASYTARDQINKYTQINYATNTVTYKIPKGAIVDETNGNVVAQKVRGQLNYNKSWGRHNVSALAGAEIGDTDTESALRRIYGYNENTLAIGQVDHTTAHPNIINGAKTTISNGAVNTSQTQRFISYYANGSYSFRNTYTVSGSVRKDGSNLFGVKANDKWSPFWSLGLSWVLSNEEFLKVDAISYLKLRTTYGYSGNADLSSSAYNTITYSPGLSEYTQTPTTSISRYANPELRWEKVGILNLGLDFGIFNNRITGSLEYYHKKSTDLLGRDVIDYTTGVGKSIVRNTSHTKANGVDLELNTINTTGSFKWQSTLFINFNKDEVTKYLLGSDLSSFTLTEAYGNTPVVGKPIYGIYSYKWAGLDPNTGDPLGYLNGEKSKNYNAISAPANRAVDLKYNGPAMPTKTGAIRNTFSYANLSLSINITGKFGYFVRKSSLSYSSLFNAGNGHGEYAQRWQKNGDELTTNVPSMLYPVVTGRDSFYALSDINVTKGDHIRINYINMAYDFKKLKPGIFKQLQLYANAANLGILWRANKYNLDPDYLSERTPPGRTYAIGLRAQF